MIFRTKAGEKRIFKALLSGFILSIIFNFMACELVSVQYGTGPEGRKKPVETYNFIYYESKINDRNYHLNTK